MEKFILALDQGTTSSRAIVFSRNGEIKSVAQKEFTQIFPKPGWVEHDPFEIWSSQVSVAAEAISKINLSEQQIAAIGITNQRETTIVWDRKTGKPVYNAIVWQDRRTAKKCDELKEKGLTKLIQSRTGLIPDAYFSATKIQWILNHIKDAKIKAENGELAFGTVDSWLVWNLTKGEKHITDVSNASRTMVYNINELCWDKELLDLFAIPEAMMPEVVDSSGELAFTKQDFLSRPIPISGIAGDQQAALFGQQCIHQGMAKNTYGTGCFMLMNTGNQPIISESNLLATIAWKIGDKISYALEGSIFIAGAAIQWLRDQMGIISSAAEVETLARTVEDNGGVYFVPALTGLGSPHWDQYARGSIFGLTRGATKAHIARATLEGICFQVMEVLVKMKTVSGIELKELRVDGGASVNNLLMQIQSDILRVPVIRPQQTETTALGAAYLAGLAVGFWESLESLHDQWKIDTTFNPEKDELFIQSIKKDWQKAVERSKNWLVE
ncbi:MAG: glycerol kinase GlpK [Bacteroidota bacterium]